MAHFRLTADESRLTLSAHEKQGSSMSVTAAAIGGGLEGRPGQSRILRIASGGYVAFAFMWCRSRKPSSIAWEHALYNT